MCEREFVVKGLVGTILGGITFGLFWIVAICLIFGSTRQALWDKMASTLVVDDPAKALG